MPDLPIRFNPSRLLDYKKRLVPSFQSAYEGGDALALSDEEPTPLAAFVFLVLFVFFSCAQLAAWLPGWAPPLSGMAPTGMAYVAAKLRLSLSSSMLALISIILYKSSRGERFLFTRPQALCFLLLMVCMVFSVPASYYRSKSLQFITERTVKLFVLFFLTINVIRNTRSLKTFLWVLVLSGCVPAVGTFLSEFFPEGFRFLETKSGRIGWTGYYVNANTIAAAMVILIPMCFCLIEVSASWLKKAVLFVLIGFFAFIMLRMLSRTGVVSLGGVLIMYVVTGKRKVLSLMLAGVLIVGVVAMRPEIIARVATIGTYKQDASAMSRITGWKYGVRMALNRPLWGVGVRAYEVAVRDYSSPQSSRGGFVVRTPHNSYITIMSELGFIGFGAFLALVGFTLRDLWKQQKKLKGVTAPGADELSRMSRSFTLAIMALCLVGLTLDYCYDWIFYMLIALGVCLKQIGRRYERIRA